MSKNNIFSHFVTGIACSIISGLLATILTYTSAESKYVTRSEFQECVARLRADFVAMETRIEKRSDKMEDKIDQILKEILHEKSSQTAKGHEKGYFGNNGSGEAILREPERARLDMHGG